MLQKVASFANIAGHEAAQYALECPNGIWVHITGCMFIKTTMMKQRKQFIIHLGPQIEYSIGS